MRDVWITTGESPTVYRYIDWLITVPLLMLEFYFVLAAVGKANSGVFWRLLIGSVVMLVGGYLGEAGYINTTLGFVIGMAGWFYILYEVFSGEAGKAGSKKWKQGSCYCIWCNENDRYSWLGYLPIRLCIWLHDWWNVDANSLNVIYNAADFLNKTRFWSNHLGSSNALNLVEKLSN